MVTVVICTYNDSHLLMPALKSCISQGTQVRVIIVDDCSTTPLVDGVRYFAQRPNVTYVRHKVNMGLSGARNTGVYLSNPGDLVIPLDSDDALFPGVLAKMERAFDADTDVVYGNLWSNRYVDYPAAQPWSIELLRRQNPIFSTSMFRREIWDKVGGYLVREGSHYEDWQFWNKCFMAGARFKYLDELIYEHVERQDSMLRKLERDRDNYIQIATECLGL